MSGNLESHVQTQDRRYTQKRLIKIVVPPPADLCDLWKQEPQRVIISAEVVSQRSTVNILKCPVFNKKIIKNTHKQKIQLLMSNKKLIDRSVPEKAQILNRL